MPSSDTRTVGRQLRALGLAVVVILSVVTVSGIAGVASAASNEDDESNGVTEIESCTVIDGPGSYVLAEDAAPNAAGIENDQIISEHFALTSYNQFVRSSSLVDQQRSMMRSEQQFQPNPDPSAPRPRPSGSIDFDSENITLGESFNVTVNVTNIKGLASQPAGAPSLISVSFPYLDRPEDSARVEIVDHNFPKNSVKTSVVTRNGAELMYEDGETRSVEYAVAEVSMIEGEWEEGESRFITVNVTPRNSGEFKVNARARLWNHESVQPPKRQNFWPGKDAGHRDQQLYSVRYEYVDVVSPPPDLSPKDRISNLDLVEKAVGIAGGIFSSISIMYTITFGAVPLVKRRLGSTDENEKPERDK